MHKTKTFQTGENWNLHTRLPGKAETMPPKPELGAGFRAPEAALFCRGDDRQQWPQVPV